MFNGKLYIYPNLITLMVINGDTLKSLAAEMGMGYQALSARMRGQTSFELPQIHYLIGKYQKPFDFIFTQKITNKAV